MLRSRVLCSSDVSEVLSCVQPRVLLSLPSLPSFNGRWLQVPSDSTWLLPGCIAVIDLGDQLLLWMDARVADDGMK